MLHTRFPLLLALLLAAAVGAQAQAPAPAPAASDSGEGDLEQWRTLTAVVAPGAFNTYVIRVDPPEGTNPAVMLTLTQEGGQNSDVDLYCNRLGESDFVPGPDTAEWSSFSIGINKDQVWIPPLDEAELNAGEPGTSADLVCAVWHTGFSAAPVPYTLSLRFEFNITGMIPEEEAVARELFDRCCTGESSCRQWKVANADAGGQATGLTGDTLVDPDLCQFGACEDGYLVQLVAQGWNLSCPFPGDLFANFEKLQGLFLSFNQLTGDINEVARNLSALPDLQELGLSNNLLTGRLDGDTLLCDLVQGTVEMLQVSRNGLTGTLPACLFNGNSTLWQFSAANNQLQGSLPDAFQTSQKLQLLDVKGNQLVGGIPASLANAPSLAILDVTNNSLAGSLPTFTSSSLQGLYLSFNNFSGAVPSNLGAHPTLRTLDLQNNSLSQLPSAWIGQPDDSVTAPLRLLRLSDNQFSGGFPAGLATFPNLTFLLLDDNDFSGPLPNPAAGQFPRLRIIDVSNNRFSGTLGDGWAQTGIFRLPPRGPSPAYWNTLAAENNTISPPVPAYLLDAELAGVNVLLDGNGFEVPENSFSGNSSTTSPGKTAAPSGGGSVDSASSTTSSGDSSSSAAGGSGDSSVSTDSGSTSSSSSGSSGLSGGAIAGIVIGVVVAVAIAALVAVRLQRRRRAGPQTVGSGKFDRFIDDEAVTSLPPASPHFRPAVELTSSRV